MEPADNQTMRGFLRERARRAHDRLMRPTTKITVLPQAVLIGVGAGLLTMFVLPFWWLVDRPRSWPELPHSVLLAFVVGPLVGLAVVAANWLFRRPGRSGAAR